MLGLCQIGKERVCRRVNAPAVLMHFTMEYVDAKIASLAGSGECGEKISLSLYFFSRHEEERLANRLRHRLN